MEGVSLGVPPQELPPSITEWSTDLHYGFPSSFPGRGVASPRGLWPLLGNPTESGSSLCQLPREILWGPPFLSPLSPASLGSQAPCLSQVLSRCRLL